ncbi:SGNH/GDSL hydrolase family protein [candidate division KSB1 bacterium]
MRTRKGLSVGWSIAVITLTLLSVQMVGTGFGKAPGDHWEETIRAFEAGDKKDFPAPGVIVFIGSSSIAGWRGLSKDFKGLPVLNRGFGGSQMADALQYVHRIVIPYRPSRVVLYEGDNDIAAKKSPETIAGEFHLFLQKIHKALPGTPVYFLSIKPSPARWKLWSSMREANGLIRDICSKTAAAEYIDVGSPLLDKEGKPLTELYRKDGLHLTKEGYKRWTAAIRPYLEKPLE